MSECGWCNGTRKANVLNVWGIQRRYQNNGGDLNAATGGDVEKLPFIVLDGACANCCGFEAHDRAVEKLMAEMGGNPWSPETYDEKGQA